MDNKKKERSQLKDAEILFYLSWFIMIMIFILLATSCNTAAQTPEEEMIIITMSDGKQLELVADEYGGQYLKQNTKAGVIYVPYIGAVEETDTLRFYNAKNK
jgi:hypothetical protein